MKKKTGSIPIVNIPDDLFDDIAKSLHTNHKNYLNGKIKWMEYCQQEDYVFDQSGVDKKAFLKELAKRKQNLLHNKIQ